MKNNLITSIVKFAASPTNLLEKSVEATSNRASSMGDMLESYVKMMLSDGRGITEKSAMLHHYSDVFSYTGNTNNPPDIMYKSGDAFEVKKVESIKAQLPLNSSHPKNRLYASDSKISKECRECETWDKKDIFYTIGYVKGREVKHLWFVHGECYAADKDCYERVVDVISSGIDSLHDVELSPTNELARINKVDPLGITYLRVRGMWGIDNPSKLFDYVYKPKAGVNMNLAVIMTEAKYEELNRGLCSEIPECIDVKLVKIQNPNNPARMINAKLLTFNF